MNDSDFPDHKTVGEDNVHVGSDYAIIGWIDCKLYAGCEWPDDIRIGDRQHHRGPRYYTFKPRGNRKAYKSENPSR
jgi:hypothetical protein